MILRKSDYTACVIGETRENWEFYQTYERTCDLRRNN